MMGTNIYPVMLSFYEATLAAQKYVFWQVKPVLVEQQCMDILAKIQAERKSMLAQSLSISMTSEVSESSSKDVKHHWRKD